MRTTAGPAGDEDRADAKGIVGKLHPIIIDSVRNWVAGLLVALATLFLHRRWRPLPHGERRSARR